MRINPKILRKSTVYSLFFFAERFLMEKTPEPPNAAPTNGPIKIGIHFYVATVPYHPTRVLQKVPTSTLRKTCLTNMIQQELFRRGLTKGWPKTLTSWKHEFVKQLKTFQSPGTESLLKLFRSVGRSA